MKKSKQDQLLQVVQEQLKISKKEIIWLGHPPRDETPSAATFFYMLFHTALLVFSIRFLIKMFGDFRNHDVANFSWAISAVLGIAFPLYQTVHYIRSQQMTWYGVTKDMVFWIKGKKLNKLLYSEIAQIHLVGRNDNPEYFTIHFNPNKRIDFTGYNYEKMDTRPFPTFELIYKGDELYHKIMELWRKSMSQK